MPGLPSSRCYFRLGGGKAESRVFVFHVSRRRVHLYDPISPSPRVAAKPRIEGRAPRPILRYGPEGLLRMRAPGFPCACRGEGIVVKK